MTIVKSVKTTFPGFGHVTSYGSNLAVAANVGATAITLAVASVASATLTPISQPLSNGRIRVRTATVGAASTSILGTITATDGTTTVNLYGGDTAASAANTGMERVIDFVTNLNLNSFTINVTTAVANCTMDVEIAGNL